MRDRTSSGNDGAPTAACFRMPGLLLAFCIFFLSIAHRAEAEDPGAAPKRLDLTQVSIEALMQMDVPKISSASKFEQKQTEAPASVTVISAEETKLYGYRTLADVLDSVQGFHVSY